MTSVVGLSPVADVAWNLKVPIWNFQNHSHTSKGGGLSSTLILLLAREDSASQRPAVRATSLKPPRRRRHRWHVRRGWRGLAYSVPDDEDEGIESGPRGPSY